MTVQGVLFNGFNKNNQNVKYFLDFNEQTFVFSLRWNYYAQAAFLSIKDDNDNNIISGRALTNGLVIRNNKLPHVFYFLNKNGQTYEPTLKNIADEFVLAYDDGEK